jgi:hypothetical protein
VYLPAPGATLWCNDRIEKKGDATMGSAHDRDLHAAPAKLATPAWAEEHHRALLSADVRRLALALSPYGILHRDALAALVGAQEWREGAFEQALKEAVRQGVIERLPEGFYGDPERRHHPALGRGAPSS